ncbi:alpha/beta hydrolase fold domain-containing protein [Actinomadura namibiensis]|uniref:Acetyl esterase n=1 Tax=Actinomadura namibiensis TaxID=182080 RepID=A0A7W3LVX5_ACTNM|nr:alpha/beta hydrolase fold domain-containing protein [Actinomadura namibiensis]MBA8955202.1 acetyl esterase [Actinomadura namibiensis]
MSATRTTPARLTWHQAAVPGADGIVPARVHRPAAPGRWLVWAHGGSWRTGSAAAWHGPVADLALAADAVVVSLDYRLAPAHRHPAALLDVLAAVDWARARTALPVAVGGDSAGATLAATAALVARDRGVRLAAQVLAYPPIDPACRAASYRREPAAFPTPAVLRAAWADHRGPGGWPGRLYSTPLEAADLRGAPPAAIAVGDADPVADDTRAHADRLRRDGVAVRLAELPGLGHGAFLTSPLFRRRLAAAYTGLEDPR